MGWQETETVLEPPCCGCSQGQTSWLPGGRFWSDPVERRRAAEQGEGAAGWETLGQQGLPGAHDEEQGRLRRSPTPGTGTSREAAAASPAPPSTWEHADLSREPGRRGKRGTLGLESECWRDPGGRRWPRDERAWWWLEDDRASSAFRPPPPPPGHLAPRARRGA